MSLHIDPTDSLDEANQRIAALSQALYSVLVASGVINTEAPCDGPNLLVAADTFVASQ